MTRAVIDGTPEADVDVICQTLSRHYGLTGYRVAYLTGLSPRRTRTGLRTAIAQSRVQAYEATDGRKLFKLP